MKLKVMFGETVPSSMIQTSNFEQSKESNDKEYVEFARSHHQVCFSNEFAPGWRGITTSTGSHGDWYMGCCFICGLEVLTVEQLQKILKGISEKIGDEVYGTTSCNMQHSIKKKMDKFVNFIISNSPIILDNIYWESHINSINIQYMLEAEAKHMKFPAGLFAT